MNCVLVHRLCSRGVVGFTGIAVDSRNEPARSAMVVPSDQYFWRVVEPLWTCLALPQIPKKPSKWAIPGSRSFPHCALSFEAFAPPPPPPSVATALPGVPHARTRSAECGDDCRAARQVLTKAWWLRSGCGLDVRCASFVCDPGAYVGTPIALMCPTDLPLGLCSPTRLPYISPSSPPHFPNFSRHQNPEFGELVSSVAVSADARRAGFPADSYPPPPPPTPCISSALVQATVRVGTVLIWDFGVAYTRGGGYMNHDEQRRMTAKSSFPNNEEQRRITKKGLCDTVGNPVQGVQW